MADECGPGYYRDHETGECRKSITTSTERKGTFGEGFLSEPQDKEYEKIDQIEKKESPGLVVKQTAAMNSWTSRDRKGSEHRHAHSDLEYAEKIEAREDPGRGSDPGEARREGHHERGGEMEMEKCGPGEEYIKGYTKDDGTRVDGYCRKKHDHLTEHDRRVDRKNGKKAGRSSAGRRRE